MSKQIAVLMTCHNRREKTLNCLRSLFNCSLPEEYAFDVFLVDDGSTDNTATAVKQNFSAVNIITGNGKLYWNRGMHLAWTTAAKKQDYDFYLWLNDDVILFPGALKGLFDVSLGEDVIVVGSMCTKDERDLSYGGRNIAGNLLTPNGSVQQCFTFNGNLVLIPQKVFIQLGPLDPLFLHSIGDFDYALRAKKKGIKCFLLPAYSGYCEKHPTHATWCLPEVPFFKRLKALYTPLANSQPYYYFRFELRHYGIVTALKHFITIHLRVSFPKLWIKQL